MQGRKLSLLILTLGLAALILRNGPPLSAAQGQSLPENAAAPAAAMTPAPSSPGVQGPFAGTPVSAFSFDGDVRRLPQPKAPSQPREAPRPLRRQMPSAPARGPSAALDPVRQAQMGTLQSLTPLQNFAGLSFDGWYPPDPNGDVGPNHYVQAVNVEIGIFSKTGTPLATLYFSTLFSNANGGAGTGTPCDNYNYGDPIVLYDATVDRWLVADFAWSNSNGPFYECIAFSQSGDPVSGGWWLYPLQTDLNNLGDYPKFGVWADGIYMSANMFDSSDNFVNTRVWALNRSDMLNGAAMHYFYANVSSAYGNLLPGNLRGSTLPPAGEPAFFASVDQPSTFHLWKFQVNWSTLSATFTGPTNLTVANFAMPCNAATISNCVPQPGVSSSYYLDSLGDRLMMQLQYRNLNGTESLWANHTVAASANTGYPTGIRWYEIRNPNGTPYVYQQGTYQPDSNYRWMGSLAVDGFGNMALGYSVSSSSVYPSIRYTGRLVTDTLGTLPQAETTLMAGTGSQAVYCSGQPCNRWGDYSAMTIDPTDDCTFWYTNEYYTSTGGNWQTRIGSFRLASTSPPPPPPSGAYLYYFPVIAKAGGSASPHCN
jgi:hypothetical protein